MGFFQLLFHLFESLKAGPGMALSENFRVRMTIAENVLGNSQGLLIENGGIGVLALSFAENS